jgi:hypothetical protein
MQNFSFPVSTQSDLEFFFKFFSRKFQSFSEEILSEFQNNPNLSMLFHATTSKSNVHAKFQLLTSTQTDLDKFLTIFQVNFRIFFRKFQKFPILKKFQIKHP